MDADVLSPCMPGALEPPEWTDSASEVHVGAPSIVTESEGATLKSATDSNLACRNAAASVLCFVAGCRPDRSDSVEHSLSGHGVFEDGSVVDGSWTAVADASATGVFVGARVTLFKGSRIWD